MTAIRLYWRLALAVFFTAALPCRPQEVMGGAPGDDGVRLIQTDLAALELEDSRKDLPCDVTPVKPVLGFDLRMHAGYQVSLPLRELAGRENQLTVIFRVMPDSAKDQPTYFTQRFHVPPIEEDARGDTYLEGSYDLGEGKYRVDWLMRDLTERVCTHHWDVEAELPARDKDLVLGLGPGRLDASGVEVFREEEPVVRTQTKTGLNVKVLVNFAPPGAHASALQPPDRNALLSILRSVTRDPRIERFSVVAFNLQDQRVVFRQEDTARLDYAGLGDALGSLNLGTIDVAKLNQKNSDTLFLADLIQKETAAAGPIDALVFAGPKAILEQNVPEEELRKLGPLAYPLFYMNYNLNPIAVPWRDAIGNVVRYFKGTEYTITRPRDMWFAVGEMVSRIAEARNGRPVALAGGRQ
jgi:hypothetical protein